MKKITSSKPLCIAIMIILIIAGLLLGGMWSLNARYERISAYSTTMPGRYNAAAASYNENLEKFPANMISKIMPVKGYLEYDSNAEETTEPYNILQDISAIGAIGVAVLIVIVGAFIKLIY